MKHSTKIRFTAPQLALVKRAHPDCRLGGLTEVAFVFDHDGHVVDCVGTVEREGADQDRACSGLAMLYTMARKHYAKRQKAQDAGATVLQFDRGRDGA